MSWIFENREVYSEKNGTIKIRRFFGIPEISVNGYYQSGIYMNRLWTQAIRRIPGGFNPKRILILGLGAGGLNRICEKKFPAAKITTIEWDEKMIELAKDLRITVLKNTEIINDEASSAIQKLSNDFDLIFFDLYTGSKAGAWHENFFQRLSTLLSSTGFFVANVFKEKEQFEYIAKYFDTVDTWKYQYNRVGLFKKDR